MKKFKSRKTHQLDEKVQVPTSSKGQVRQRDALAPALGVGVPEGHHVRAASPEVGLWSSPVRKTSCLVGEKKKRNGKRFALVSPQTNLAFNSKCCTPTRTGKALDEISLWPNERNKRRKKGVSPVGLDTQLLIRTFTTWLLFWKAPKIRRQQRGKPRGNPPPKAGGERILRQPQPVWKKYDSGM